MPHTVLDAQTSGIGSETLDTQVIFDVLRCHCSDGQISVIDLQSETLSTQAIFDGLRCQCSGDEDSVVSLSEVL
jgi:hypothetical protein